MFKSVEDFQQFGKSQIEAATASVAAVSRGMQQMATEASAYAKRSVEDGSAATTRLMGAKSLDGAVQVQAEYAKAAFEGLTAQVGKMSALMMSVGKDAAKPFEAVMPFDLGKSGGR
ncbi:phasin family protein [Lichenibacterium dinghuense]|uniref:phasin family protein n=1 Tax=Lichenibacterium dinghuense TaxID=2895977 RepID=UPI001F490B5B|nr:phasin family protein [Lichenibacterium sp. 6Y81]